MVFRAVLLAACAALPLQADTAHISYCPLPPMVEYYHDATEEQILPEDIVGVWYVEDVIPIELDVGIVYAVFISPTDLEYEIDTGWISYGDQVPVPPDIVETQFRKGILP